MTGIIINKNNLKIWEFTLGLILTNLTFLQPINAENIEIQESTKKNLNLTNQLVDSQAKYQVLSEALAVANTIEDPKSKASLLSQIANQYIDTEISEVAVASDILSQALAVTDKIEDFAAKANILKDIALTYIKLNNNPLATEILSEAETVANNIENPEQQASILTDIALKYTEIGQHQKSSQLLAKSQEIIVAASRPPVLFPFQPTPWLGNVGVNLNFSSDQDTTSVTTLSFGLERQLPKDNFDLRLSLSNDYDDSRVSDDQNDFSGDIMAEYRHHFSKNWQYFVSTRSLRNDDDGIRIRSNLYTGPGINIWRAGPEQTLDMQLGAGVRYEDSNRRTDDFDGPVFQYKLRYYNIVFSSLRLRQFLIFELPPENTEDYYIESSTTLSVPLTKGWSFDNSLLMKYSGIPTFNNPNFRINFQAGIKYDF